ncbi:MAG TPA: response regulator [Aggregatilineales bacterium]|nr:response regulator [Aggregatilineales bacterium]
MKLTNKRIFIIEDDPKNLTIMEILLRQCNAQTQFERWGRDTVSRLLKFAPVDLILLDLNFPNNVTGYDIYDAIRQVPALASIPVVAVSASDASTAIPKTQAKGFAGFIGKPIDILVFPQQIAAVMDGKQIWQGF